MRTIFSILLGLPLLAYSQQGPYSPPAGQPGSNAIQHNSYLIAGWASGCDIERGYQDVSDTALGLTTVGNTSSGIGPVEGAVVSLGDGGIATLTFDAPIQNTLGADIAVFENSFSDSFLELAHVEISSDGINFYRFPSISLTNTDQQIAPFASLDATLLYNLAGKFRANFGTPFDFQELDSISGLDINAVTHVRVIDVIGSIDSVFASYDSEGNIINDPWPTNFESSGFDLDGVAIIGNVTGLAENGVSGFQIYPNPAQDYLMIDEDFEEIRIHNLAGALVHKLNRPGRQIQIGDLESGIYIIELMGDNSQIIQHFVKL